MSSARFESGFENVGMTAQTFYLPVRRADEWTEPNSFAYFERWPAKPGCRPKNDILTP